MHVATDFASSDELPRRTTWTYQLFPPNRFFHYHSLQKQIMLVGPIEVQRLMFCVGNWYSLARKAC